MSKELFLNILLLIFSILVSLLLLEQSYRFYLFGKASFSFDKMNSVHPLGLSGLIEPSSHSEIIFELKPNLNTYFQLTNFKTNSEGLRDKDYSFSKDNNIFRVAVIGDSFAMPLGVELDESFHSLLEEKFNNRQQNLNYQFINFGVGGYSLRQYLGVLKFKAQKYNPDLVLIIFCPYNDQVPPNEKNFIKPYKVKQETFPFFESFVLKSFNKIRRKSVKENHNNKKTNLFRKFPKEWEKYMSNIFSDMNSYSKKNHTPVIIVYLTNQYDEKFVDALKNIVENSGLNFADASYPFKELDYQDYRIYPTDNHPNGEAHKIFANELYDYLINFPSFKRSKIIENDYTLTNH